MADEEVVEKSGNSNKMLIIVLAVIITIDLAGTFVFFTMFKGQNTALLEEVKNMKSSGKESSSEESSEDVEESEMSEEDSGSTRKLQSKDYFEKYTVYMMDDIIVNVQSNEGNSFLVVKIGMEYLIEQEKLPEELGLKKTVIRDEMNSVFAAQTIEDLRDLEKRKKLKKNIKQIVNSLVDSGKISRIMFSKFVIQ